MPTELTPANILTFIKTDPLSVGFAAIITANPGLDGPLEDAANDVNGPGSGTVGGDGLPSGELVKLIDKSEWNLLTILNQSQLTTIGTTSPLDMGSENVQGILEATFANCPKTLAVLRAKYTRRAGAWEVYFGKGHTANGNDIDSARNITPGNPQF